jgi:hypothetical protein
MSTRVTNFLIIGAATTAILWYQRRDTTKSKKDEKTEKCVVDLKTSSSEQGEKVSLREIYKPWAMTQSAISENKKGWVYVRGYSGSEREGSVLWYKPGLHKLTKQNHEEYFRALINGVETSVRNAVRRSNGKCAKCNVVLDANDFGFMDVPPMNLIMKLLPMFDVLFAGHLGMLIVVNMAAAANMFFQMVLPFLPIVVRNKIHLLPSDKMKRLDMLKELVEEEFIPTWLGGRDEYQFDVNKYYATNHLFSPLVIISDEEAREYSRDQ